MSQKGMEFLVLLFACLLVVDVIYEYIKHLNKKDLRKPIKYNRRRFDDDGWSDL